MFGFFFISVFFVACFSDGRFEGVPGAISSGFWIDVRGDFLRFSLQLLL